MKSLENIVDHYEEALQTIAKQAQDALNEIYSGETYERVAELRDIALRALGEKE